MSVLPWIHNGRVRRGRLWFIKQVDDASVGGWNEETEGFFFLQLLAYLLFIFATREPGLMHRLCWY